jgi:3-methyladenine DNA glycosylase Tag
MPLQGPPPKILVTSLDDYLEVMSKAVFQSGISWKVVDSKWPGIQEAFRHFKIRDVADLNERDLEELEQDPRVIRNHRKLAAIVTNAQAMLRLDKEHGGFKNYLRQQGDFDGILAALRKDFKFLGPTGVYYFLHVVGETVPPHTEFEAKYRKAKR